MGNVNSTHSSRIAAHTCADRQLVARGALEAEFASYPEGRRVRVFVRGPRPGTELATLEVDGEDGRSVWVLNEGSGQLMLEWAGSCSEEPGEAHLLAALEAALTVASQHEVIALTCSLSRVDRLVNTGTIQMQPDAWPTVTRGALWQEPRLWVPAAGGVCPLQYTLTRGQRHPLRPPKPAGVVYRRDIPWLAKTLSFRSVELECDLPIFNRWMNDPRVAHFWQERGDLAKHRAYLEASARDPHATALIGCFDEEPFGYFEVYWAKEDRIAPFYDAQDFDRGWHVLVGEARFRGRPHLTAWMPSMSHYLFLDDCRTQRIVIEPRSDNHKMIKSLARCGYAQLKEFDFPHKRAMLGMLLRERFFGEALWIPRSDPADACLEPYTLQLR